MQRGVEQWLARRAHNPEAVGSNPAPATNFHEFWRGSSVVELGTHKPSVVGSNPTLVTQAPHARGFSFARADFLEPCSVRFSYIIDISDTRSPFS
jgi:hypothetical protein